MSVLDKVQVGSTTYDIADAYSREEVVKKANFDGSYATLTAGNAEQLVSTVGIEDKVPYNFRTSGGSVDIGNREKENVIGGTIAWNQQIQNGNFASSSGWSSTQGATGSISVANNECALTCVSDGNVSIRQFFAMVAGHKYLIFGMVKGNSSRSFFFQIGNVYKTFSISDTYNDYYIMLAPTNEASGKATYSGYVTGVTGDVIYYKYYNVIDLTQMFGSTIADYIYTLETTNAGSGVAWFRKLFPKSYYAYNAGTLMSVKTSGHQMTGFNQWDEECESGYIDISNGNEIVDATKIRMKNYVHVLPNTTYYKKSSLPFWNVYFDANKNYIGYGNSAVNTTFTTPSNCYYIRSGFETAYGTTYKHDTCINLSWDGERNGEYEPYELYSYPLDDIELRGLPKLDANNTLYYDGDVYQADGTVTRKYGIVDLGTLTWNLTGSGNFQTEISGMKEGTASKQICIMPIYSYDKTASSTDKTYWNTGYVYVRDTSIATAAAFKTAMSGVYLVYELATQTEESATPYQENQVVNDFGTEEYVDTRDVPIPVGHDTLYQQNLRAKLEMAPNSPGSNGDYVLRHTNGANAYVPMTEVKELPDMPSSDGTYKLQVVVSSGTATLSWVSA